MQQTRRFIKTKISKTTLYFNNYNIYILYIESTFTEGKSSSHAHSHRDTIDPRDLGSLQIRIRLRIN